MIKPSCFGYQVCPSGGKCRDKIFVNITEMLIIVYIENFFIFKNNDYICIVLILRNDQ